MKKIVYFYFSCGARYGFGHYSRCLVLKNLLKRVGISSYFLKFKNIDASYLGEFKLITKKKLKNMPKNRLLIIDDYKISSEQISNLKNYFSNILLIDDDISRRNGMNAIVNPNYQIKKKNYMKKGLENFFLGTHYKIVSFDNKKKLPKKTKQITISFGGSKVFNQIKQVLKCSLKYFEENNFKYKINIFINLKRNQKKFFKRFKKLNLEILGINKKYIQSVLKSKFCISSLGVQHDELVFLKIPSIFFKISDNQNLNYKYAKSINRNFVFDINKFKKDLFLKSLDEIQKTKVSLEVKKKYKLTRIGSRLPEIIKFIEKKIN